MSDEASIDPDWVLVADSVRGIERGLAAPGWTTLPALIVARPPPTVTGDSTAAGDLDVWSVVAADLTEEERSGSPGEHLAAQVTAAREQAGPGRSAAAGLVSSFLLAVQYCRAAGQSLSAVWAVRGGAGIAAGQSPPQMEGLRHLLLSATHVDVEVMAFAMAGSRSDCVSAETATVVAPWLPSPALALAAAMAVDDGGPEAQVLVRGGRTLRLAPCGQETASLLLLWSGPALRWGGTGPLHTGMGALGALAEACRGVSLPLAAAVGDLGWEAVTARGVAIDGETPTPCHVAVGDACDTAMAGAGGLIRAVRVDAAGRGVWAVNEGAEGLLEAAVSRSALMPLAMAWRGAGEVSVPEPGSWRFGALSSPAKTKPGLYWWREPSIRARLLALATSGDAQFVYHLDTARGRVATLRESLPQVAAFSYAMKANSHPALLRAARDGGMHMECVSLAECRHARRVLGGDVPLLFTPNFCPPHEYGEAIAMGACVTLDSVESLATAGAAVEGAAVALRVDPGVGRGHCSKVRTAGPGQKFGLGADRVAEFADAARAAGARVVGLHAHAGSGIRDAGAWRDTAQLLAGLATEHFADTVEWVDIGGGLGVVNREEEEPLDLCAVGGTLDAVAADLRQRGIALKMEPGRYVAAECGALLAQVTQVRQKGSLRLVGVSTGMNSLVRPAMYGSYHAIYNLSRLEDHAAEGATLPCHVVGPICETGDVLGEDRLLPAATAPGDVLLIANAGAYGRVMSSSYNMREPATEVAL